MTEYPEISLVEAFKDGLKGKTQEGEPLAQYLSDTG